MYTSELKNWSDCKMFRECPVWTSAFEWIENHGHDSQDGFHYDFADKSMFASVMTYDLKDRNETKYESHKHTIDLQFTLSGCEGIEYMPIHLLNPVGDYIEDKDFQFYETPNLSNSYGMVNNYEGHFCILWPSDGHMPQMKTNNCECVRKLVVKIPVASV
jgi:YhcH/YjgK/YiaL family protein